MSARWPCTICSSAIGAPNSCRSLARASAFVERAAGKAERRGADRRAEHVEHRHGDAEAVAGLADQRGGRHATPSKAQARQRMRRDDLEPLGDRQPRRVGGHEEGGEALGAGRLAGAGEDDVEVGDAAVGDPGLLAVEQVAVAVARRRSVSMLATSEPERGSDSAKAAIARPARVCASQRCCSACRTG